MVQKRFNFPPETVELYAEKVPNRGLCAVAQAESLRYKLLGGLAVRRCVCAAAGVARPRPAYRAAASWGWGAAWASAGTLGGAAAAAGGRAHGARLWGRQGSRLSGSPEPVPGSCWSCRAAACAVLAARSRPVTQLPGSRGGAVCVGQLLQQRPRPGTGAGPPGSRSSKQPRCCSKLARGGCGDHIQRAAASRQAAAPPPLPPTRQPACQLSAAAVVAIAAQPTWRVARSAPPLAFPCRRSAGPAMVCCAS